MRVCPAMLLLIIAALAASPAAAREPSFGRWQAVQEFDWYYLHPDSLLAPGRQAEPIRLPTNKLFYLEQKYGLCPSRRRTDEPESLNVRMVGKWGGGPSWGVTGRDTLVYLSRGSEVVVINFADTANPEILNHIQARRLAGRPVLQDSLLYLATSGYVEVFDVSDPTNAPRVGRQTMPVADIDVEDTLVYVVGADSFQVWSFADPANPQMLGACRDSGYALDVDRGCAYLRDRWGMYILDATDPASPHRIASWGTDIAGVKVRDNHCYVAQGSMGSNSLHVLNVSNPASPWQEGVLSGLTAEGLYLVDTLLFTPGFDVVNVADSSRPEVIGNVTAGGDDVWANPANGFAVTAAGELGLRIVDVSDVEHPLLDTLLLGTYSAVDIVVGGGLACVATYSTGTVLLDVSDPSGPWEVGRYDSAEASRAEALALVDSVLYVGGFLTAPPVPREILHVADISDPVRPLKVGRGMGYNPVGAMVLRDSLLYLAEEYQFEVFSVADPRQPVWRGRCNLSETALDVVVRDTLAYVACLPSAIVNIVDPSQPEIVGSISTSAYSIAVYDTFAYLAVNYGGLKIWSIADPTHPYRIDTIAYTRGYEVEVAESLLLYGGLDFRVLDLATPALPLEVGSYETPYRTRKVDWDGQYVYAACIYAGVCVLDMMPTAIAEPGRSEPRRAFGIRPTVTRGVVYVQGGGMKAEGGAGIPLLDVAGRRVAELAEGRNDLSHLSPGVYFAREYPASSSQHPGALTKLVVQP